MKLGFHLHQVRLGLLDVRVGDCHLGVGRFEPGLRLLDLRLCRFDLCLVNRLVDLRYVSEVEGHQ